MPTFDVFLSHNSIDKPWVIKLKDDLICYGVSVWLDQDEIRPGDLFARALEDGLESCRAVALIVSPEAMASGWVEEEYYRALSLTKARSSPVQLIPVILRDADVPGFVQSRNWVDFRDETAYAHNVWKLVWGITGQKPPEVLDLNAPPLPSIPSPAPRPAPAPTGSEPATGIRTGGIRAGGNIRAKNVVAGVQIQGGDAETARAALELARNLQTGGIEATGDIIADNLVDGFQFLGQGGTEPNLAQFRQELAALREQLAQAIAEGEFDNDYDAEDAQTALSRAADQAKAESPPADKIVSQLDRTTTILTRASETAVAAGKFGVAIIKLAPLAAGLKNIAEMLFS